MRPVHSWLRAALTLISTLLGASDASRAAPWSAAGADSSNVSILGFYPIASARGLWDCAAYVAPSGHEYALIGADSLHVVDLVDPARPKRVTAIPTMTPSYFVDVAVRGHCAYAAHRTGPILIVDLVNPHAPVVRGQIPQSEFCACSCGHPCTDASHAEIETLFIDERGVLYVTGIRCGEGIQMYDIATDPVHPRWLCHEHTFAGAGRSYYVHDVYVRDGLLIVSRSQGVPNGDPLSRWDILDGDPLCPNSPGACGGVRPGYIGSFRHSGEELHAHSSFLLEDPRYLLTCDEKKDGHIRVWDVAQLTRPVQVGEIHPDQTCHSLHNVYVRGTKVYAAWYNHGIEVFEFEDPLHPTEVGYYHHPNRWRDRPGDICCDPTESDHAQCFGVPHLEPNFPSGIFVATDIDNGMMVGRYQPRAVSVEAIAEPRRGSGELLVLSAPGELPVRLRALGQGERELEIVDASGARVARLNPRDASEGAQVFHNYEWDGTTEGAGRAPAGVYFVRDLRPGDCGGAKLILLAR